MCLSAIFGGGAKADKKIAQESRQDEIDRQNRIKAGMSSIDSAFSGFNDAFYNKRAADYTAFATPDMERQAKAQHDNLIYALSRTGNLDSSAAINKSGELDDEANRERINIANAALEQANQLRSSVENTRSGVVAELNATGDSTAASAAALRNVQNLSQPAGYSPLGNLFANFANSIAGIGSNANNGYGGFAGGGGGGLFRSSGSAQRVVG